MARLDFAMDIPSELEPLAGGFIERRASEVDNLASFLREGDFKSIASIAHRLKGNGTGYGFRGLSLVGSEMEQAAKREDADAVRALIEDMRVLLRHFRQHMQ